MFKVSKWLYWSAQHDRIFKSGTTAFLVAKNGAKIFIHIWVELFWNSESNLIILKSITGTYFGAIVAMLNFCDLGAAP